MTGRVVISVTGPMAVAGIELPPSTTHSVSLCPVQAPRPVLVLYLMGQPKPSSLKVPHQYESCLSCVAVVFHRPQA